MVKLSKEHQGRVAAILGEAAGIGGSADLRRLIGEVEAVFTDAVAKMAEQPAEEVRCHVPGVCGLCNQPMPPGEEMFFYHGYSGPCPKPPAPPGSDAGGDAA